MMLSTKTLALASLAALADAITLERGRDGCCDCCDCAHDNDILELEPYYDFVLYDDLDYPVPELNDLDYWDPYPDWEIYPDLDYPSPLVIEIPPSNSYEPPLPLPPAPSPVFIPDWNLPPPAFPQDDALFVDDYSTGHLVDPMEIIN